MTAKHVTEGKMVACTIKIRQICVLDDGTINCVAIGEAKFCPASVCFTSLKEF